MEVAYYTIPHRVSRKNNVVSLDDYREKLLNQVRDAEYESVEEPAQQLLLPEVLADQGAYVLDMVASAALSLSAVVSMCVIAFSMI